MNRTTDPLTEDSLDLAEEDPNRNDLKKSLYRVEPLPTEAKNATRWIKRVRDKGIRNSLENPFEDDQEIMSYLDRAIDSARNPLDQLELKMLHESLCREIHREKRQKKKPLNKITSPEI